MSSDIHYVSPCCDTEDYEPEDGMYRCGVCGKLFFKPCVSTIDYGDEDDTILSSENQE